MASEPQPLARRLNNRTQQLNTVVTAQHRGFTLAPAIDWKTGNKGATLSHKFRAGTLKATYAHDKQLAGLNYDFKPFNVRRPFHSSGFLPAWLKLWIAGLCWSA